MDESLVFGEVVTVVQARTMSERLPGKVLLDIEGEPMLVRVVERAKRARLSSGVIVATSDHPSDDELAALCRDRSFACFRGSMDDVLDRVFRAVGTTKATVVVRVTADCPFIDPALLDIAVAVFTGSSGVEPQYEPLGDRESPVCDAKYPFDFVANRLPPPWGRTFPIGLDVEVCSTSALERAWGEAEQPHHREHVMPYLYEVPGRFRGLLIHHTQDFGSLRWTVDTSEDLRFAREVFRHLGDGDDFTWGEVLRLVGSRPELARINAEVRQRTAYHVDDRP